MQIAELLSNNLPGIRFEIDMDYNDDDFYMSNKLVSAAKGWANSFGYKVNIKRIRRLMRLMGLEAIYPKPKTSIANSEHKVYPYLLNSYKIDSPNQVWSTDITYIQMEKGFLYLTAVIDWFSRYVISWRLSNSMDNAFCIECIY